MKTEITVGTGSAYPTDLLQPAIDLAESGEVSYLCFDRLSERTLGFAQIDRLQDPSKGYDARLPSVLSAMSGFLSRGGRVIGNFGAANPEQAGVVARDRLRELGLTGHRIGVITGDDVLDLVIDLDLHIDELGETTRGLGRRLVSANAYIGAEPIAEALSQGASVVLGGRLADPSLYVGPIMHELGWSATDWDRMGQATAAGHLLECGSLASGGNFADPPHRVVPDLHRLAMPFATVSDGRIRLRKLPDTGGAVDVRQVQSQFGYEVLDPAEYRTPDSTADFSRLEATQVEPNVVDITAATGRARPDLLKVVLGVDQGYKAIGEVSYSGPRSLERARQALALIEAMVAGVRDRIDDIRFDIHGLQSVFPSPVPASFAPNEVRIRVAALSRSEEVALFVADCVEKMYMGPAGGCGVLRSVTRAVGAYSVFVPRDQIQTSVRMVTA